MGVQKFDHVGVNVDDLDAMEDFFRALGFEVGERWTAEGAFIEDVIGVPGVRSEAVMITVPGGDTRLELSKYHAPAEPSPGPESVIRHGYRHIAFEIDDLDEALTAVRERGLELVGEITEYEDIYRMCFVRGPEGLIVELAQRLSGTEPLG
ncbi:VOC family protein [Nakamurella sp. YIM 132087]|uniref:VOC family protein n=1 Tax=Nakamurella alba TaxID=2665158 RepID=A0A7K1FLM0_9ACTN|nr:VOC family protein [Nakamurella alba]MTD15042.1 VOC family protein [Nakamurella alba]